MDAYRYAPMLHRSYSADEARYAATSAARAATPPTYRGHAATAMPRRRGVEVHMRRDWETDKLKIDVIRPPLPMTSRHPSHAPINTERGAYKLSVPSFRTLIGMGMRQSGGTR